MHYVCIMNRINIIAVILMFLQHPRDSFHPLTQGGARAPSQTVCTLAEGFGMMTEEDLFSCFLKLTPHP